MRLDAQRSGALLLVLSTALAIAWVNLSPGTYEAFWATTLSLGAGDLRLDLTLHDVVNEALMAVFFFTVGLEVRRELTIGELTSFRRALAPVVVAVAGLVVPALLFMLVARGTGVERAWGVVISTDTAFLVGVLALVGPRRPGRLRTFVLALAVVDDIGALAVIALLYTQGFDPGPLLVAAVALLGVWLVRYVPVAKGPLYAVLAVVVWLGFLQSGVHPTLAGVAIAMLVPVYRPSRRAVEQALGLVRTFRQSPSTAYAQAAANGLRESISINERLQHTWAPYVAFVILPLFALSNAGVRLSGPILTDALHSRVTWGVVVALVLGKLVGVLGSGALVRALRLGDLGRGVTLDRLAGGAALCGIGFTIALFITELAIDDPMLQNEARVGVLAASLVATLLGFVVFRVAERVRPSAERGRTLDRPVDPVRDHVAGRDDAPLTLVEYGDFECEFCGKASGAIDEVTRALGDRLRYVWRHAPHPIHPRAVASAEAAEAAARQGAFFPFLRVMFAEQAHHEQTDLLRRAAELGLDPERFESDLGSPEVAARVRDDARDAAEMDIDDVPTFFVNGHRHTGPYDARTLVLALEATASHPLDRSSDRSPAPSRP
ncbi:Na+/H+ antiporter NhaA [Cellulomonas sp. PhB143]|uniref:Na+/H+ antiporter NhaA n=1 Tax=Cellulomonas sp. PhB143 TaxID=2485186 RepID=UPI000F4A7A41|nr:Na+/H+ antiporter NhaA [Cellulomonas sp. PhB143]ROS75507.1 sodium/proton antiporter (NhaA family) [Cellulomonas sp. PhB143]